MQVLPPSIMMHPSTTALFGDSSLTNLNKGADIFSPVLSSEVSSTTRSAFAFFLHFPYATTPLASSSSFKCSPPSCRSRWTRYRLGQTMWVAWCSFPASTSISQTFAVRRSGGQAASGCVRSFTFRRGSEIVSASVSSQNPSLSLFKF